MSTTMHHPAERRIHRAMRHALLGITFICAGSMMFSAHANTQRLESVTRQAVDIPAGPLGRTLSAFAVNASIALSFDPSLTSGKNSPHVTGNLTGHEVMARLLAGSGLELIATADGNYTLVKADNKEKTLPVINVVKPVEDQQTLIATSSSTGTKSRATLLENPQSVSVVTSKEMEQRGVKTVSEAIQYMPGTSTDQLGMDNQTEWISLRGFSSPTSFLDGLRLNPTWQVEPYGLDRVEVLRGPASVLYGESIPGGITGMVSKRPSQERGGEAQFQLGNEHRVQGAFDVTGPVDDNSKWLYRVVGLVRDSDSAVDYVKNDRLFLAPSLTWRPSADTSLTIMAQVQRDKIGFLPQYLPMSGTLLPNPNGKIPRSRYAGEPDRENYLREQAGIGYALEHRFNDTFTLQQNVRYEKVSQKFDTVTAYGLQPDQRTVRRRLYDADQSANDFSVDTNLATRFTTGPLQHTLLTGVEYTHQEYDYVHWICGTAACAPPIDIFNPVYGQPIQRPSTPTSDILQHQERLGLYTQDQIKLDRLVLTLGGRWDTVKQRNLDRATGLTERNKDNAFTGRAGAAYLFDNGVTPYASFAQSFQPTGGLLYPGKPAKPVTGEQVEMGLKYQPQGQESFIGIAAYTLKQQNMVTEDPDNPGFIVQSAHTQVRGAELEAKLALSRQLSVLLSYTFTNAKYTRSNDNNEGNQVSGTPRSQAAAWLDYTFAEAAPGMSVGAGIRYVGDKFGNASNTIRIPSYTVIDAALRYDMRHLGGFWKNVSLSVNANNLFDRDYVAICTSTSRCYFGAPRTVVGTLTYRW